MLYYTLIFYERNPSIAFTRVLQLWVPSRSRLRLSGNNLPNGCCCSNDLWTSGCSRLSSLKRRETNHLPGASRKNSQTTNHRMRIWSEGSSFPLTINRCVLASNDIERELKWFEWISCLPFYVHMYSRATIIIHSLPVN